MSAGRDAWSSLLAMVEAAIDGKLAEEQERRLAQLGSLWWKRNAELAKPDPLAAGRLAAAQWQMMSAYRPESPCALDADFRPTEDVPTSPPTGRAA